MARTLSSTLTTALNANTRRPAVSLTAEDHIAHFSLYQSPNNPDAYNDAVIAPDRSIVRAMVTRNGFNSTASYQRITDPTNASQWLNWTNLPGTNGTMFQDGGCAISVNGSTVRIFVQQGTGGNALYNWYSNDNGVTWLQGVILSPPGGALIKGIGSCGNNDVFFIYDISGGEAIGASLYTTGWSTIKTWTLPTIAGGAGLDAWYGSPGPSGIYTIVYSDGYSLKSCTYNPTSNVWATGPDVARGTSTAIARIAPHLSYDTSTGLISLVSVEQDSGLITGSVYSYPRIRQSADLTHWSNGLILHAMTGCNYGANFLALPAPNTGPAGARYYITAKAQTFSAPMFSQANANQYADLSAAILSYTRTEHEGRPSRLDVLLDNNKGVYSSLVNTGSGAAPIGPNTTLVLSEGYLTGSPPTTKEVVATGRYHVQQILFERSPHENRIRIIAHDVSRNLDLESRFQITYTNQTVAWLVTEMAARGGLFSVVLPATTQMSQVIPTFTLHAAQKYRQALDELCTIYGLVYFLDQAETLQVIERNSGAASVWAYQPEVELIAFGTDDLRANHVIVSGKPPVGGQLGALTTAEAYDDPNITVVGIERMLHHTDQKLTTTAQCSLKAQFLLAEEQRAQVGHVVTVPLNPALQLIDVVTLTDSNPPTGSGQSGTVRIIGTKATYDPQKADYDMSLTLEGA